MPVSPLTRTTERTTSDVRLFTILDLQAEADRLLTSARRTETRDGASPWVGDQYAGYRIRAEAVGGMLEGLRGGRTLTQAVADGAESGRRAVADYLTELLNRCIGVYGRSAQPGGGPGGPGEPATANSARVAFP